MLPKLGVSLERCVALRFGGFRPPGGAAPASGPTIEGRSDDNEASHPRTYAASTDAKTRAPGRLLPPAKGVLREVDGVGTVDEVAERIEGALESEALAAAAGQAEGR